MLKTTMDLSRRNVVRAGVTALSALGPLTGLGVENAATGLSGMRVSKVDFGAHRLVCYRGGVGPTVLLLHGNPGGAEGWRHQVKPLMQAGYEVLTYDLLGTGQSSIPPSVKDFRFSNEVSAAWKVVDSAGVGRLHAVIGHDRGGVLGWRMASQAPQRVGRLIALSVGHPTSLAEPDIAQIERFWYNLRFQFDDAEAFLRKDNWRVFRAWMRDHPETPAWIEQLSRPGALTALVNFWRANTHPETSDNTAVPAVSIPVTGIWSAGDVYCNERQMLRSEQHARGGWRYRRIEDASHFMQLDQPAKVAAVLLEELQRRGP